MLSQGEASNPHPDPLKPLASFTGRGEAGSCSLELPEPSVQSGPADLRGAIAALAAPPVCPHPPLAPTAEAPYSPPPGAPFPTPHVFIRMEGFLLPSLGCSHVKGVLTQFQSRQGGLSQHTPTQLPQPPGPREQPTWLGRSCSVALFLAGSSFWFVKTETDPWWSPVHLPCP